MTGRRPGPLIGVADLFDNAALQAQAAAQAVVCGTCGDRCRPHFSRQCWECGEILCPACDGLHPCEVF